MDDRTRLDELLKFARTTPERIKFELIFCRSYAEFVALVDEAIDWVGQEFARNAQFKQDRSEDELSVDLVIALKAMGFWAGHDTAVGGHCDIVIEGARAFLWLGEAKIHRDYDWLLKGYRQLTTRYSTGNPEQDAGGLVIYCFGPRIDEIMKNWNEHLVSNEQELSTDVCPKNALAFLSMQKHTRTGRQYRVRHVPISLHHKPLDNEKSKKPRGKAAGK